MEETYIISIFIGFITDKNTLPVTRLNFGRTQLETSSGIHTLGRLDCTGSVALMRMPVSCEDLFGWLATPWMVFIPLWEIQQSNPFFAISLNSGDVGKYLNCLTILITPFFFKLHNPRGNCLLLWRFQVAQNDRRLHELLIFFCKIQEEINRLLFIQEWKCLYKITVSCRIK